MISGGTPIAKAALWAVPDAVASESQGSDPDWHPGSPGCKRWTLVLGKPAEETSEKA